MQRPNPRLAKLSSPRLHGAVSRERLFEHLAGLEEYPVTWLSAPPGAGKTTLAATYLDAYDLPSLWYQLDAGDADPAAFFYFLRSTEQQRTQRAKRTKPLPLLTPEYLNDLGGFSRRFFRELFSRLPPASVLVLDNLQEVQDLPTFSDLLGACFQEVPAGCRILAISRADPPEYLARLLANRIIVQIGRDQLALTARESIDIASAQLRLSEEDALALHDHCAGWAAGLILLIERLRRGGSLDQIEMRATLDEVFDYFATELFDHLSEDYRRSLLRLSYVPRIRLVDAEQLTGDHDIGVLLERLYRRNLFTNRHGGTDVTYQFHALFRTFLQHRARITFSTTDHNAMCSRAGHILQEGGEITDAIEAYFEAKDSLAAERLISEEAARLIAQGRWRSVVDWIERLPASRVAEGPWLLHWLGTARIGVDPARARLDLEEAHRRADASGDPLCALQAAAGIVQTYMMQYRSFRPLDRWIPVLERAFDPQFAFPSLESELRILSALFVALSYRHPLHPRLAQCRERMFELTQSSAHFPLRLNAALYLLLNGTTTGLLAVAHRTEPILRELLQHPEATALNAGMCWFSLSWYYHRSGKHRECRIALDRVEAIASARGLPGLIAFAAVIGFWFQLGQGDMNAARTWSMKLDQVKSPGDLYGEASSFSIKGWLAFLEGNIDDAIRQLTEAVRLFDELGSHMHRISYRSEFVWPAIAKGDFDSARLAIVEARAIAGDDPSYWSKPILFAAEAWIAARTNDHAQAVERMERALETMRQQGHDFTLFHRRLPCLPQLMALGRESKEVTYADKLIRLYALQPPTGHRGDWPSPISIRALGEFELRIDGTVVTFGRKVPKKPLKLLQALVCYGPRPVNDWQISDALWPDEEGDISKEALRVNIHRLRHLLGRSDAIDLHDGRIGLNAKICSVDAWSMAQQSREGAAATMSADALFTLYRGPLLPDLISETWTHQARERLREKFKQAVQDIGAQLESAGELTAVADLYRRASELEPTLRLGGDGKIVRRRE